MLICSIKIGILIGESAAHAITIIHGVFSSIFFHPLHDYFFGESVAHGTELPGMRNSG